MNNLLTLALLLLSPVMPAQAAEKCQPGQCTTERVEAVLPIRVRIVRCITDEDRQQPECLGLIEPAAGINYSSEGVME